MKSVQSDIEICILPGFDGSIGLSQPFVDCMPPEQAYRLIAYPPDRRLSHDQLTEYVESQIPIDRGVLVVGVSFSGPIALRLIQRGNRRYVGAIFCTTFARSPRAVLLCVMGILPVGWLVRSFSWRFVLRLLFFDRAVDKELASVLRISIRRMSQRVIRHRFSQLRSVDEIEHLKNIDIPCLYLQATNDILVPPRDIVPFQEHLSRIEVCRIAGPHALLSSRPEECWEAIDRFVRSIDSEQ